MYFYYTSCADVIVHVRRTAVMMVSRGCSGIIEWIVDQPSPRLKY
jgi:hypothetical protein